MMSYDNTFRIERKGIGCVSGSNIGYGWAGVKIIDSAVQIVSAIWKEC